MAIKTKAQILSEIATLLADNTTGDISANDVRTILNDITDSYGEALYVSGTLNQSQILALDSVPIEVIPAQGSGKMIKVKRSVFMLNYNSSAYSTSGFIQLDYSTGLTNFNVLNTAGIVSTSSNLKDVVYKTPFEADTSDVFNTPVQISSTAAITGGNSTIKYFIEYEVIDFN